MKEVWDKLICAYVLHVLVEITKVREHLYPLVSWQYTLLKKQLPSIYTVYILYIYIYIYVINITINLYKKVYDSYCNK